MSHFFRALAVCAALVALTSLGQAEIIVKRDLLGDGGEGGVEKFMTPGLRIAVRLQSPVNGTLVGVQIFAGPQSYVPPVASETKIRISAAEQPEGWPHPVPTTLLATIESPVLEVAGLNEFRYLDPATNLIPLGVPVSAGQSIFIDLEGTSTNRGFFMDVGPTDAWANLVEVNASGSWFPASLIADGNFAIRAIIHPVPEPGTGLLAASGLMALGLAYRCRKAARGRSRS